jgi:hypothetical protein
MHVFVPLSDELLYDHPDCIPDDCRPYQCGMRCVEWLAIEPTRLAEPDCQAIPSQERDDEQY